MREYANPGEVKVLVGLEDVATAEAQAIVSHYVPEWLKKFLQKNRKYKAVGNSLGAKGIFPDINRKVGILKSRLWDGEPVVGEPTDEVIQDLIGHLFLMLAYLGMEAAEKFSVMSWETQQATTYHFEWPESPEKIQHDLVVGQGHKLDEAADRLSREAHGWTPQPVGAFALGVRDTPGYGDHVEQLLVEGWVLRCGNCRRRLGTEYGRKTHRVFDDLSGTCLAEDSEVWEGDAKPVSTSFMADPHESTAVQAYAWAQGYTRGEAGGDNANPYKRP